MENRTIIRNTKLSLNAQIAELHRKGQDAYVTYDIFERPIRCREYGPGSWAAKTLVHHVDGRIERY